MGVGEEGEGEEVAVRRDEQKNGWGLMGNDRYVWWPLSRGDGGRDGSRSFLLSARGPGANDTTR